MKKKIKIFKNKNFQDKNSSWTTCNKQVDDDNIKKSTEIKDRIVLWTNELNELDDYGNVYERKTQFHMIDAIHN